MIYKYIGKTLVSKNSSKKYTQQVLSASKSTVLEYTACHVLRTASRLCGATVRRTAAEPTGKSIHRRPAPLRTTNTTTACQVLVAKRRPRNDKLRLIFVPKQAWASISSGGVLSVTEASWRVDVMAVGSICLTLRFFAGGRLAGLGQPRRKCRSVRTAPKRLSKGAGKPITRHFGHAHPDHLRN